MTPFLALLPPGFGTAVVMAAIYAVIGVLLMAAGFWIFDLLTPGSLQKEIFVHRNIAAGVLAAGVMVAIGIVVYASFQ